MMRCCCLIAQHRVDAVAALLELKAGWRDPRHSLDSWGAGFAKGDPCGTPWPHLQCDGIHVVALLLGDLGLEGTVSPVLADMGALHTIQLHNNTLTGTIPVVAKPDATLTNLWLFDNQLTGTLPEEYYALTTLLDFRLFNNPSLCGPYDTSRFECTRNMKPCSVLAEVDTRLGRSCPAPPHVICLTRFSVLFVTCSY